jgi:hypothetical protein
MVARLGGFNVEVVINYEVSILHVIRPQGQKLFEFGKVSQSFKIHHNF